MSYFIRVDAETEVAYELIDEPIQELQAGEQEEGAVEPTSEEVANPADLQGKPRSITHNFSIQCLSKYLCIYVLGVVWKLSMHVLTRYP